MYEDDRTKTIADLRARIASLRSRLAGNTESPERVETQQRVIPETTSVEEPTRDVEQREKRNAELEAMKSKLMRKK